MINFQSEFKKSVKKGVKLPKKGVKLPFFRNFQWETFANHIMGGPWLLAPVWGLITWR